MSSIDKSIPNVLMDEQHAQVNCLYTLCQTKSNHSTIDGNKDLLSNNILELYNAYRRSVRFQPSDVQPDYRASLDANALLAYNAPEEDFDLNRK